MVEGQLVRGRIDPDIAGNELHFWQIDLPAGYHHVVVDTQRIDGRNSNIGLQLDEIDAAGDSNDRLIRGNEIDYRTRLAKFFVNSEPRTILLQVKAVYAGEDYVLGVFGNGRSIPSPRFEACPEIRTISPGSTQSLALAELEADSDYAWQRIDLTEGAFEIFTLATRVDGEDSNIQHRTYLTEQFGQASTEKQILGVNEIGTVSTDEGTFDRTVAGPVWLRTEADRADLNVDLTVNPAPANP